MKKALVCGAGGFIGGHLVKKLKTEGYWVRGVDIKEHEFAPTAADEFLLLDLREPENCKAALSLEDGHPSTSPSLRLGSVQATGSGRRSGQAFDEVYQLAADMGGMGLAGGRRSQRRFAVRLPRRKTVVQLRSGATGRPFAPTPTSATWWTASISWSSPTLRQPFDKSQDKAQGTALKGR